MAGVSRQKQKLLIMEQLFRTRTDENHAITGNELIKILGDMGIKAERKTIYDDIATLCDAGLDIQTTKIGHSNAYFMGERLFSEEELRIIVDAVASSRFLTIKRSGELIRKIQQLTSEHKAPALRRNIHIENRTKSSNDPVYRVLDVVQEAVHSDRQVEISISETGADKKRSARKQRISPYQVVLENEHYYIICRAGEEDGEVTRIRADRISDAELLKDKRISPAEEEELTLRKLKAPLSNQGSTEELRIRFDGSLIDAVFDRFGDKLAMHTDGDGFYIDASVQLSPAFWGWLFQFGDKAKIVSPAYVADMAYERLTKLAAQYRSED